MTDLKDKVIVVTGASTGIGKTIAENLVAVGAKVVGCSNDLKELNEVAETLKTKGPGKIEVIECDVAKEDDVIKLFKFTEERFGTIHGIINNAGVFDNGDLLNGKTELWKEMYEVDVLGVAICCREAVKLMKKCGVDDGHVVNINSLSGHRVVTWIPMHFHSVAKHGVTAVTEGLRQELRAEKSHIRVTAISPGMVKTGITRRLFPDPKSMEQFYAGYEPLHTQDVADAVLYAMKSPSRVDVSDIHIRSVEAAN